VLAENGRNRDYLLTGAIRRDGRVQREFTYHSYHYKAVYKATPFYERLFASGKLPVAEVDALSTSALAGAITPSLPAGDAPAIVLVPQLPRLSSGELDIAALPLPVTSATLEAAPMTPLQSSLAEIWKKILGLAAIGLDDNFFEIGGDSLSGLRVVNRLREVLDEHVSLVVIFEGPTIGRLSLILEANYAEAVQRWLGVQTQASATDTTARIGEADVAVLRSLVTPMGPYSGTGRRNPSAIFILSPMRSGSTLLRIMLAGNPRLFAPPELQLLGFENLAERKAAFTGYDKYLHEGVLRAIMEIRGCDAAQAESIVAGFEQSGAETREFYAQMQQWTAPRTLVDKTPDYAMDIEVLRRAEAIFDDPLYIHLARHPLGMIRSYEKGRFLLESPYRGRHDFTARQMAELTWLVSHRNILEFLKAIPASRQHRVRFEDLVANPDGILGNLCEWLEIPFAPEMSDPYKGGSERMTDGIHPMSPQVGDANFYQHGRLKPEVAATWKQSYTEDFLSPITWEIAAGFDYPNPFAAAPATHKQPIARLSRDQRRISRAAL